MNIDSNTIRNGMETVKNLTQVASNLTKSTSKPPQEKPKQENTNQPHTQTVEVKVGEQGNSQKPLVLKEKNETHVHKVFPDQRELSERECSVREMELKNEHEYKMKELEWRMKLEEEARKERKEREERAEKDRERRRERDRKYTRNVLIGVGVVCTVAAGAAIYSLYTDSRSTACKRLAVPTQEGVNAVPVEGEVK